MNDEEGKKQMKEICIKPRVLTLDEEVLEEIQTQTLRVKLISSSVKNPKKDHTRLETVYNEKLDGRNLRALKTMGDECESNSQKNENNFMEKYKNLD